MAIWGLGAHGKDLLMAGRRVHGARADFGSHATCFFLSEPRARLTFSFLVFLDNGVLVIIRNMLRQILAT